MPNVPKPKKNGEVTAAMFNRELDLVMVIKQRQTFTACLFTYSKQTRMDHHVLQTFVATDSFSVSSNRLVEIFGDERIHRGRS